MIEKVLVAGCDELKRVWVKKNQLRLNAFDKNVGEIIFQNEDGRWEKKTKCGRNTRDAGDLVSQGVTALRNKT